MSSFGGLDLNADLGEGFGRFKSGDDEAMLEIVTSASVACGFHAGDPEIMSRAFALAKKRGVAVGAHPGFPDLWGFGRRDIPSTPGEFERMVAYQIGAAQALASLAGYEITYVKPHGALGNLADVDRAFADAVARAIKGVNPSLALVATALGSLVNAGEALGLRIVHEIFADRAYREDGMLVDRSAPGAVIHDPEAAAARVLAMLEAQAVITAEGARLATPIDTICVHGDTPQAVTMARSVRKLLEANGVVFLPFAPARPSL